MSLLKGLALANKNAGVIRLFNSLTIAQSSSYREMLTATVLLSETSRESNLSALCSVSARIGALQLSYFATERLDPDIQICVTRITLGSLWEVMTKVLLKGTLEQRM